MTGPAIDPPDMEENLRSFLRAAHRTRWAVVTAAIVVLVVAVIILGYVAWREYQQLQSSHQQLQASCDFYHDIGAAPLPVKPPSGRQPSAFGVAIVLHSRIAFAGQGCPGALPSPGPGLKKWASYYHLSIPTG